MGDQLKPGIAVVTTFSEGETPSPAKLNSISAQLKRGIGQSEKAIGDTLGQSWPYIETSDTRLSLAQGRNRTSGAVLSGADERALDIVNLARLVGPASNLNPRVASSISELTEDTPIGVHEFSLRFAPESASSSHPVFSDTVVFATFKSNPKNLRVAGDYHVSSNGKVFCATVSTAGTVTYSVDARLNNGVLAPQDHRFNVIPDPNQLTAGGTGIQFAAKDGQGRYPASIPAATHQQSNIQGTSITLDSEDLNYGETPRLPKVLTDNFTAGQEIPAGFIVLKNFTTNEVYEDAIYYYNGVSALLIGAIDIDDAISNGDQFCFVTVGSDITGSIDDLRVKSFHSHNREHGEPFVDLDGISGFLENAGASGVFVPSGVSSNFAPQYLHRDGWIDGVDDNLNDENAMRGALMMANANAAQGSRTNVSGESFPIYLSDTNSKLYRDSSDDTYLYSAAGDVVAQSVSNVKLIGGGGINIDVSSAGITLESNTAPVTSAGYHVFEEGFRGPDGGLKVRTYAAETTISPIALPGWQTLNLPAAVMSGNGIISINGMIKTPLASDFTWIGPGEATDYDFRFGLENSSGDGNVGYIKFGTGSGWSTSTTYTIRYIVTYYDA